MRNGAEQEAVEELHTTSRDYAKLKEYNMNYEEDLLEELQKGYNLHERALIRMGFESALKLKPSLKVYECYKCGVLLAGIESFIYKDGNLYCLTCAIEKKMEDLENE